MCVFNELVEAFRRGFVSSKSNGCRRIVIQDESFMYIAAMLWLTVTNSLLGESFKFERGYPCAREIVLHRITDDLARAFPSRQVIINVRHY